MTKELLRRLIEQALSGDLSLSEQAALRDYILNSDNREEFIEVVEYLTKGDIDLIPFREEIWLPIIQKVVEIDADKLPAIKMEHLKGAGVEDMDISVGEYPSTTAFQPTDALPDTVDASVRPMHVFVRYWMRYAAGIIVLFGTAIYYFWNESASFGKDIPETKVLAETKADVAPGKEGAVLTLADGSTVVLDELENGLVAAQAGANVMLENGQLAYTVGEQATKQIGWNTLATPRGRQFSVVLPDGTGVWLNAASSITYPTVFAGKERKILMTGEAYFEVMENKQMPFHVSVGDMDIEVLGTHFNVNAYSDENISRTTLLEGSIKLRTKRQEIVIKPGEQAQLHTNDEGSIRVAVGVDLSEVMAWQKGLFYFNNTSLPDIMRVVHRWYDVDIIYETKPPNKKLGGGISMKLPLSNLLRMLEASGIHFTIEGRTLKVVE